MRSECLRSVAALTGFLERCGLDTVTTQWRWTAAAGLAVAAARRLDDTALEARLFSRPGYPDLGYASTPTGRTRPEKNERHPTTNCRSCQLRSYSTHGSASCELPLHQSG